MNKNIDKSIVLFGNFYIKQLFQYFQKLRKMQGASSVEKQIQSSLRGLIIHKGSKYTNGAMSPKQGRES